MLLSRGKVQLTDTASTPGTPANRCSAARTTAAVPAVFSNRAPFKDISIVKTLCVSNPGFTERMTVNVRIKSAAPTSKIKASAISVTTKIARALFCRNPLPVRDPLSFKVSDNSVLEALNAGINPNKIPVTMETSKVKTNTRQSKEIAEACSPIRGISPGLIANNPRTPR